MYRLPPGNLAKLAQDIGPDLQRVLDLLPEETRTGYGLAFRAFPNKSREQLLGALSQARESDNPILRGGADYIHARYYNLPAPEFETPETLGGVGERAARYLSRGVAEGLSGGPELNETRNLLKDLEFISSGPMDYSRALKGGAPGVLGRAVDYWSPEIAEVGEALGSLGSWKGLELPIPSLESQIIGSTIGEGVQKAKDWVGQYL